MPSMDVLAGMTPLDLELPDPPEEWWTVTPEIPRRGDEPLVDPGMRLPAGLELDLLSDQSVVEMRVPAADEVAAIVAASQVVRVLLGRWPGLLSAGVRPAPRPPAEVNAIAY
jgi:hypothetical protein